MKRTISTLACLALLCTSPLVAKTAIATTAATGFDSLSNAITPETKNPAPEKEVLHTIPSVSLEVVMDSEHEVLKVSLEGEVLKNLDWVIFQPKGDIISRHSTSSKINEIKINTLEKGTYVLMIKDSEGRALFRSFKKA